MAIGKIHGYFSDENINYDDFQCENINIDLKDKDGNKITRHRVKLTMDLGNG